MLGTVLFEADPGDCAPGSCFFCAPISFKPLEFQFQISSVDPALKLVSNLDRM